MWTRVEVPVYVPPKCSPETITKSEHLRLHFCPFFISTHTATVCFAVFAYYESRLMFRGRCTAFTLTWDVELTHSHAKIKGSSNESSQLQLLFFTTTSK